MSTARGTWKAVERRVAVKLGGRRVVCSGVRGEGDVEGVPGFIIEVKMRKKIAFKKWFDEIATKAKERKKVPVLIVHQKSQRNEYIIFDIKDFLRLWKNKGRCC